MKFSHPLAYLSKRQSTAPANRYGSRRARRQNRRAAIQSADLHCQIESLESRLLLTVTAPASATTIQNGTISFSQTGQGTITVTGAAAEASLELTLIVTHGSLTLQTTTGLTILDGPNGSSAITVLGTTANVNADLNALEYTPYTNYTGDDSLLIIAGSNPVTTVPIYVNSWTNSTASSAASEQNATGGAGIDVSLLLPNGDLMVHQGGGQSKIWYEITPDSAGSYADGTWKKLAPMNQARLYFSSDVLPDGDVFVFGGEYASDGAVYINPTTGNVVPKGTPGSVQQYSDSGEIYDPATNTWTAIASGTVSYPATTLLGQTKAVKMAGDQPSEVLPDGDVLVGNIFNSGTEIYVPAFNANGTPAKGSWTAGPTKQNNDESDEESWVKLANGDILNYDIYQSETNFINNLNVGAAELYIPSTSGGIGQWVTADNGDLPILTSAFQGSELGPALLEPDTGDAVFFGATGLTAVYNPTTNSWTQGPTLPSAYVLTPHGSHPIEILTQLTMGDAPGAVLPNGDDLLALSPAVNTNVTPEFPPPTFLYEWNPATNVFTNVTPSPSASNQASINSFSDSMLVLPTVPTGQILLTNGSNQLAFYTLAAGDGPQSSWMPTITSFTFTPPPRGSSIQNPGSFTLTGTQLNGPDEGAAYGDDEQMAENYPIVQLTNTVTGTVYYGTTSNWSSTGVATGSTPQTATVVLPATIPGGFYSVVVIADGIPSIPLSVVLGKYTKTNPITSSAVANATNAVQLSGVAAPAGLGSGDNALQAQVALISSVTPPTSAPNLDFSLDNSTLLPSLPTQANAAAFKPVQLSTALSDSEINQWAGLSAALDILSA
jgi:Kelch motif